MIHIQQKKETTMIERQQQEALYTDGTPVLAQDIFWEGRPSFLPFLLGSESMMAMTAVWFLLFWYFDFTLKISPMIKYIIARIGNRLIATKQIIIAIA